MSNNKEEIKKQFFPALTGFRTIAAWMIFIYHFFPFKNPNNKYPEWIAGIVSHFHLGVDMFFVLSGFLITYRYYSKQKINFKEYSINRIARIYPMYFLLTLFYFATSYFINNWDSIPYIEILLSLTMTKALFTEYFLSGIAQGWTLTLEELFYLTAPLYFILIKKNKWNLILLPITIFIFGDFMSNIFKDYNNLGGFLQTNIHTFIIEFFAGICLALIVKQNFKFKTPKIPITYISLAIIIVYFLTYYFFKPYIRAHKVYNFINLFVLSFSAIAPLIWGLIYENTIIRKILSTRLLILLGKSSYIFYLIHKGFIPIFIDEKIWNNKLFIFITLNIVSILLFRYVEEPLNLWIRKINKKN